MVIHAVSLDRDRRTNAQAIRTAVHSAMARARENDVASIAFPALGTGVGGYPLDEAAQITLAAVHEELPNSPSIDVVTFALRGAAAYSAFEAALHAAGAAGDAETASAAAGSDRP